MLSKVKNNFIFTYLIFPVSGHFHTNAHTMFLFSRSLSMPENTQSKPLSSSLLLPSGLLLAIALCSIISLININAEMRSRHNLAINVNANFFHEATANNSYILMNEPDVIKRIWDTLQRQCIGFWDNFGEAKLIHYTPIWCK